MKGPFRAPQTGFSYDCGVLNTRKRSCPRFAERFWLDTSVRSLIVTSLVNSASQVAKVFASTIVRRISASGSIRELQVWFLSYAEAAYCVLPLLCITWSCFSFWLRSQTKCLTQTGADSCLSFAQNVPYSFSHHKLYKTLFKLAARYHHRTETIKSQIDIWRPWYQVGSLDSCSVIHPRGQGDINVRGQESNLWVSAGRCYELAVMVD